MHSPMPEADVTLEALAVSHAGEMFALLSDPALYAYIEDTPPASLESVANWFAKLQSRRSPDGLQQWLNWVVRDADGVATGYVQATVLESGTAYVAYVFGSTHWGRGLAHAAMRRMLALLAADGITDYRAVVDRRNERSIRLLQRLGFGLAERQPEVEGDVAYSLSTTRIE